MNDQIQIKLSDKLYKVKKSVKVIDFLNALKFEKDRVIVYPPAPRKLQKVIVPSLIAIRLVP